MGRARTAIDTDWARQLSTAGDDEGDDEGVTKVTTTSRSAVTNLMRNLCTTQSMSTTQMTQTDADAHSLLSTCKCVRIRVGVKVLG